MVIAAAVLAAATAASLEPARAPIEALIQGSGAEVSLAARTLDGQELLIEPDRSFHAASTMKVPVMIELFAQAKAGVLSLDDSLPVENEFKSIVDQSPYSLDPAGEADTTVYASVGKTLKIRDLCEAMITVSSNLAANLLLEKVSIPKVQERVKSLGADGMRVIRPLEDGKAFLQGLNNTTTARGLETLLVALATGKAVDPASDRAMVEVLKRQHFKDGIPAGLPPEVEVAHKTGEITKIQHDAGIVFGPRPFVLVVLVRGIEDRVKSAALIAEITKALYAVENPR
jgi:beta-lactamase class A